jgi:hypothetical protein
MIFIQLPKKTIELQTIQGFEHILKNIFILHLNARQN